MTPFVEPENSRSGPCRRAAAATEAGFTVAEVLVAAFLLAVALVALLASMTTAVTTVDAGRRSTTALFLAEQRMEDVRAFALSKAAGQGWANLSTASFPAEGYGAIASHPDYRRTVTVTDTPGGVADTKLVEVRVFYRQVTDAGTGPESSVVVTTTLANR